MHKVSVIIPVFNAEEYLASAIESILKQSYPFFEIILVDDSSKDNSQLIAQKYLSDQVRLIKNECNLGVAESLNKAIAECSGEYIVRMDADDIALPHRIYEQVSFMNINKTIAMSGTWAKHIGKYKGVIEREPVGPACIKAFLMLDNPIIHPTVIIRRKVLIENKYFYNNEFERCEDFDLWDRISNTHEVDNLAKPLLKFRVHSESVTAQHSSEMWQKTNAILERNLMKIGIKTNPIQISFHRRMAHGEPTENIEELKMAEQWFINIIKANKFSGIHDEIAMREALGFVWYALCRNSSILGIKVWCLYNNSVLAKCLNVTVKQKIFLGVLTIFHAYRRFVIQYSKGLR